MKPKRLLPKSKDYYKSRALLAECFGLNEDTEIPQDYDDLPASLKAAAKSQDKE